MSRSVRTRLAAVARIARWEVGRSGAALDRRTVGVAAAALLLAGGVAAAGAATGGPAVDRDIYRVGVAEDDPYRPVVESSPALAAHPPDREALERGELDVLVRPPRLAISEVEGAGGDGTVSLAVTERRVVHRESRKGRAAAARLREAVQDYNTGLMRQEENRTAAFPVVVELQYIARSGVGQAEPGTEGDSPDDGDADDGDDGDAGGGGGEVGGGTDGVAVPDVQSGGGIFGGRSSGSPAEIRPPFPFDSLVLAFAFLVPMNFVVQAYGSSMLEERINRRGELLLVTPVSPGDIVAGKTVPYAATLVALVGGIAAAVGGGPTSVVAVLPIGLTFLGATFAAAMFARSFKELTFVTVSVSVFLTAYTFVPAIFTNVTPIALISPLTLVVRDLQGTGSTAGEMLFATGPLALVGMGLFLLGTGIYREEDLFTQRSVPLKLLDALSAQLVFISGVLSSARRAVPAIPALDPPGDRVGGAVDRLTGVLPAGVLAALSIPFVLLAELLVVALLFALPQTLALPVLFAAIAVIEEVAKSLHVYAGIHTGVFDRRTVSATLLGVLAGAGFFVGEKLFVVVQAVGLTQLPIGEATAATAGIGALPVGLLLLAPLVLHCVTATVSALAATRGLGSYLGGLGAAAAIHAVYNLTVVTLLG